MRELIVIAGTHSRMPSEDFTIGCIMLQQPFFFKEDDWIPISTWKGPSSRRNVRHGGIRGQAIGRAFRRNGKTSPDSMNP